MRLGDIDAGLPTDRKGNVHATKYMTCLGQGLLWLGQTVQAQRILEHGLGAVVALSCDEMA